MSPSPSLLVFADDWDRHPSSCQHLVRQLLGKYQVLWVNTIGTRPPRFDVSTLRRGLERVRHWARPGRASPVLPRNLRVITPKMWPWFRTSADRNLNRELLRRQLAPVLRSLPGPVVALSTLPIVADLVGVLPVKRWVYYCVDDFAQWPGLDQKAMRDMDADWIRQADSVIAVSSTLEHKLTGMGKKVLLLTHGVDLGFWRVSAVEALPELQNLEPPFIVFWGVVDARMDVAFVKRLSADLKRGTIVLVGPDSSPDPALAGIKRVVRIPPLPYDRLPHLAQQASVLVMPYADLPVTRSMQPLKLKEYLATGRPVVVRDLPATRCWSDGADLASSAEDFSRAVRLRLATGLPQAQQNARGRLRRESWAEKAHLFETWAMHQEPSLDT